MTRDKRLQTALNQLRHVADNLAAAGERDAALIALNLQSTLIYGSRSFGRALQHAVERLIAEKAD